MKKNLSFSSRVKESVLSLKDAFIDYMNDNYFPGAADELDDETVRFEYESFINNYSK